MRRWLRIGRTVGFVLSGLLAAAWVLSLCLKIDYKGVAGGISLCYGEIWLVVFEGKEEARRKFRREALLGDDLEFELFPLADIWKRTGTIHPSSLGLSLGDVLRIGGPTGHRVSITYLYVPIWMPLLTALIPSLIGRLLSPRKRLAGCCQGCGYDLTGNVSGRCPECGAAVKAKNGAGG